MKQEQKSYTSILFYLFSACFVLFLLVFGSYVNGATKQGRYVVTADVLQTDNTVKQVKTVTRQKIYGAIIAGTSGNLPAINEIFATISDNERPHKVVLLAGENDSISLETVEHLIEKYFPYATVEKHIISQNSPKIEQYHLARELAEQENIVVLAVGSFFNGSDSPSAELQQITMNKKLASLEMELLKQVPQSDREILRTIIFYLNFKGAKQAIMSSSNLPNAYYQLGEPLQTGKEITMIAFGDIMLDRSVRVRMDRYGLSYPFDNIGKHNLNFMTGVDFVMANLEGPIKTTYVPSSKSIHFRFKPDVAQLLKDVGITIVTTANNHSFDQGQLGFDETKQYLDGVGIRHFGNPRTVNEENVYIAHTGDTKVGFIGLDDTIFKLDFSEFESLVKKVRSESDIVIVTIHWGIEYVHQPNDRMVKLAHLAIDSGADAVISHHPHVIQTMEIYNEKPIFYSLGNFVFDQYFSVDTQEGLSVGLHMKKNEEGKLSWTAYLYPYKIPDSQPTLMNEEEKAAFLEKFISWGKYSEEMQNQIRNAKIVLP